MEQDTTHGKVLLLMRIYKHICIVDVATKRADMRKTMSCHGFPSTSGGLILALLDMTGASPFLSPFGYPLVN